MRSTVLVAKLPSFVVISKGCYKLREMMHWCTVTYTSITCTVPCCSAQLALAERQQDYHSNRNQRHHRRFRHEQEEHQSRGKGGLLASMPPELRQAALNLIDYQLTPILVDQWR